MYKETDQNFATIMSPYGVGLAGFLSVLMPTALYFQWFNKHFQAPHNTEDYLDVILANTTAMSCSIFLAQHKAEKHLFEMYKAAVQCVWSQLQAAINEDYLAKLVNLHVCLADILPLDIYNHIVDCYAKFDLKMAEDNRLMFNESMDPTRLMFNETIDPTKPLAAYTNKQE